MRISDWSSDVCSSDLLKLLPIDFWNVPRHGGNSFNGTPPDPAYFDAHAGYGATWVRLVYAKWTPADRTSDVQGKSVSVRVALGGRRISHTKLQQSIYHSDTHEELEGKTTYNER